ncbi:TIM barrel protein [Halobacteria archaeon AArc-m2/3/4]|uniref:TIM barrel protein n=1 Tax=Natronoglomus mannanivorans TaxID=2979990 RepID=A0AAP2Z5J0_9EURY|nr:TIM barrel protein [Halobacteria archaeon AArc-xg1-1]MCU4975969.1 TIM barrel protein [Halobacteria archaeon AArc-m2/3/4]
MSQYQSLIVGCGARGRQHGVALSTNDHFELVGLCDLVEERATNLAADLDISKTYTDLHEAIKETEPMHVSCITPPTIRASIVEEILSHDIASLTIEKPAANTLEEVEEIVRIAEKTDTRVTVCLETLWADEIRAVNRWVEDGRIGNIERIVGTTKGGLMAQGTHFVHMLDWMFDETPELVRCFVEGPSGLDPTRNDRIPGHSEPMDALLEITYSNDLSAFLHHGVHAPDVPAQAGTFWLEYRLDVVGSDGQASFVHGDHAEVITADGHRRIDARDFDEDGYMTRNLYDTLAAVLDGERTDHPADLESALETHRTLDAAMRSAHQSRAISPKRRPPATGRTTNEHLRRALTGRKPITVSTLLYGDRNRETTLESLASLGIESIDLWSVSSFATHFETRESAEAIAADLNQFGMEVPVVSVFDDGDVTEKLDIAASLGANVAVMGGRSPDRPETWNRAQLIEWLDHADDRGLTLAFENHLDTLETTAEMRALLEALDHPAAGICLAPPHLSLAGERVERAIVELGAAIDVLYLWDMECGADRTAADAIWWDRPDSQVPGGGGAIDFDRLFDLAVEYCPDAHWVVCYHGTEEWEGKRIDESVRRSLRFLEERRSRFF